MPTQRPPDESLRPSARARRPVRTRRRAAVRWSKRIALVVLALAVIGAIVYAFLPRPVLVDLAVARRAPLEVEVREDGQTRVRDRYAVAAPITGELLRIELEPGDAVDAGAEVARIQPSAPVLLDARSREETTARLAVARARQRRAGTAIERARIARDQAVRDADRGRALFQTGAIPRQELERLALEAEVASRDVRSAELERAAAAAEAAAVAAVLDEGRGAGGARRSIAVTAPASGQVLRVVRESAGPVAAGATLLELGDPRGLEVVVDVLSSDAARIEPGMKVVFERWGGERPLNGRVRVVEPSAFTKVSALGVEEQRVRVIATVDDPPPSLRDGFRVDARIITWQADDVLVVPSSAVFRDRGAWAVYAVDDGRAALRRVEIGHRGRVELEVVRGLGAGDRVIAHPSDRVRAGTRVEPR